MTGAESHFTAEALGEPEGPGRYVNIDSMAPVEFAPGLGFGRLGTGTLTNFVHFGPGAVAPRHVHEEEQIVIVVDGELEFDLDGDVRTMRSDVAVVPAWVPHGAWTTDGHCDEIDVFSPPRQSLLGPGPGPHRVRQRAARGLNGSRAGLPPGHCHRRVKGPRQGDRRRPGSRGRSGGDLLAERRRTGSCS